jgi:hypothetical protein
MEGSKNQREEEKEPVIRTMAGDIKKLSGKGAPPEGLPVASLMQKEQRERDEEIEEQRTVKKEAEQKDRQEAEKMRRLREEANKERADKEAEIKKQREKMLREREEQFKEVKRAEEEIKQRQRQAIEKVDGGKEGKQQLGEELREAPKKTEISKKLIFVVLAIVLLAAGLGGSIYWWNYLKPVPSLPEAHYECQDSQCVSVEGRGIDECQINQDCQLVEPTVPETLIPVDETKTIEISVDEEKLIPNLLEAIALDEQATSTLRRILIKSVSQEQTEYLGLNAFITAFNLSLPTSFNQFLADSEVVGDNYTLFFYSQEQGNRFGIIAKIAGSSSTLIKELKKWEEDITTNLRPILFKEGVLSMASSTEGFQDNIYKWTDIRYLNFPSPDLSIDYAVFGNKLIITTSRESMYAVIDILKAAEAD